MAELPVRFQPPTLADTEGLDPAALAAALRQFVRARYPAPEPLPHEGPADEEVVVQQIARSRGTSRRVDFVYRQNRHPRARGDRSRQAAGSVRVDRDGAAVREGKLGALELRPPG
jgi:hypothetical protein